MTEHEIMAAKYANTAFAILFTASPVTPPPTDKELAIKARTKARNDRGNAKRKANAIKNDNLQKANWTI